MKRIFDLALIFTFTVTIFSMPGCSNVKPSMEPGTMHIWVAPSHRAQTDADADGNIYIKIHSD